MVKAETRLVCALARAPTNLLARLSEDSCSQLHESVRATFTIWYREEATGGGKRRWARNVKAERVSCNQRSLRLICSSHKKRAERDPLDERPPSGKRAKNPAKERQRKYENGQSAVIHSPPSFFGQVASFPILAKASSLPS